MPSEPLASILQSDPGHFDARFAAACRRWPGFDPLGFAFFLESFVAPMVTIAEVVRPDSGPAVARAGYDVALDMVGRNLAGNHPRHPAIHALWAQVLGPLAPLFTQNPARVLPALNAMAAALATTPGTSVEAWMARMAQLSPRAGDVETLMHLVPVLGWQAGLPRLRQRALTHTDALPEDLARAAVGVVAHDPWPEARARLTVDPWWRPSTGLSFGPTRFCAVAQAGAFRGFGGLFVAPPRVAVVDGDFFVYSDHDVWSLEADAFGVTFHTTTDDEALGFPRGGGPPADRALLKKAASLGLHSLGRITSSAQTRTTLALTGSLTHTVWLISLPVT